MFTKVKVLVTQSCPTLCNPMDRSSPGSFVHGILQARILEWVAISSSRVSSRPRDWTTCTGWQADALLSKPSHAHTHIRSHPDPSLPPSQPAHWGSSSETFQLPRGCWPMVTATPPTALPATQSLCLLTLQSGQKISSLFFFFKYNSYDIKITIFRCMIRWVLGFSIVSMWCNHHHYLIPELSSPQKVTL